MKKGLIYTIIFTLFISFLFVFILALANEMTRDITEKNEELARIKAILRAFNIEFSNENEAYTLYMNNINTQKKVDQDIFLYQHNNITHYAIHFSGIALWGQVEGILAVNENVTRIIGLEFLKHNETPGLGGRIDEQAYKDQWKNENISSNGKITGTRNNVYDYDHKNGKIDSITGATRTSERIVDIINLEISRLKQITGVK